MRTTKYNPADKRGYDAQNVAAAQLILGPALVEWAKSILGNTQEAA